MYYVSATHQCACLTDVGLATVMKGQTELAVVKLKGLPQLTAKGLSTLCSAVLETVNLKSSGVSSEGGYLLTVVLMR